MDTRINNGMCRCCASDGTSKDLCSTYHWMGDEEVYSDMLKECFDITLETSNEGGICEVCITQLRNASNFKKQVLKTEQQFKNILQDKLFRSSIVKVEVPTINDEDSDNDNHMSEDFSGTDYEIPIKMETPEEPKSKKRAAKATTSRTKKARGDDGETSTKRSQRQAIVKCNNKGTKARKVKGKNKTVRPVANKETRLAMADELAKHYVNIKEILNNSNATPIRCRGGIGYTCCYCTDQYPNPADLKKHTLETHDDITKACFMQRNRMFEYFVRLDITDLTCNLCDSSIDTVENLIHHLKDVHDVKIYADLKNHILPFKFVTETLQCFICLNVFNKFKSLLEHMNSHYRNYICETCDAGFVNLRQLSNHKLSHITGTFPCSFCSKIFDTFIKKQAHEKSVHIYKNILHKCGYCNERFTLIRFKEEHMVAAHGVQILPYKCQACEKVFDSLKNLYYHTKRDHLMERLHKCAECEKAFFSPTQLRFHMLSHTGVKEYQCDVCLKSYGRKYTLKEHMRIHADDRRFKCEHCGQAFVQKCSWKSHMRAKHGEAMAQ